MQKYIYWWYAIMFQKMNYTRILVIIKKLGLKQYRPSKSKEMLFKLEDLFL